jgi:excisionase family DNA binding protein
MAITMDELEVAFRNELLTFREAARLLCVQPSTIRMWSHQGVLPFVRIGRKAVRYRKSEVLRLITEGRVGVETQPVVEVETNEAQPRVSTTPR